MLTRFAPAPTGYLHLGHVANAIKVWDEARARGGKVLLRIEDHDRERCRPEYEAALLEDLDWLGFVPDIYPTDAFRAGPCESRQSDRTHIYAGIADELRQRGLLYACRCSRKESRVLSPESRVLSPESRVLSPESRVLSPESRVLSPESRVLSPESGVLQSSTPAGVVDTADISDIAAIAAIADITERPYPGTCAHLGLPFDGPVTWRVRMPPDTVTFDDRWCGPQVQTPAAQCGDLSIRDRHGNWTYQFVVTVDDHLQGITDVIRGVDLLASTGRQMLLGQLIGRPTPATFAHHPLIMKSPTQKLSKSDADTGVRDLRASGWSRERVKEWANEAMRQ